MSATTTTFSKNTFWIFLSILAVLAIILCGVVTSKYGAGISSDSTKYLSVAQNLLEGKGLVDHRGAPLLSWPPLYSMLLAGLSLFTGLDVFVAGWYFNVFLYGLNVFLSGVIFQRVFSEKPFYAYLASLFVFLSISSLRIHSDISSDPFYLTLTLGFLIAVEGYIRNRSHRAFAWMLLFSIVAPLQRYVGLAIIDVSSDHLMVQAPPNRNTAPPGYYMLFIVNRAGVPSVAHWIRAAALS